MWFFIFYRARQDGAVLLVRPCFPSPASLPLSRTGLIKPTRARTHAGTQAPLGSLKHSAQLHQGGREERKEDEGVEGVSVRCSTRPHAIDEDGDEARAGCDCSACWSCFSTWGGRRRGRRQGGAFLVLAVSWRRAGRPEAEGRPLVARLSQLHRVHLKGGIHLWAGATISPTGCLRRWLSCTTRDSTLGDGGSRGWLLPRVAERLARSAGYGLPSLPLSYCRDGMGLRAARSLWMRRLGERLGRQSTALVVTTFDARGGV